MKNQCGTDITLNGELGKPTIDPYTLADQDETIAWSNGSTIARILDSAQPEQVVLQDAVRLRVNGRELGGGFDHQYTGKNRITRHVPANPEFIVATILVSDCNVQFAIDVNHPVEHTHTVSMRINRFDRGNVVYDFTEIHLSGIENRDWGHAFIPWWMAVRRIR